MSSTNEKINWDCLSTPERIFPIQKISDYTKPNAIHDKIPRPLPVEIKNLKPFDIDSASRLLPWEKVQDFRKQTENFEVVSITECQDAFAMAMQSRKLAKAVEAKRKEITKPHLDFQKGVKKIADAFLSELKSIELSLTKKVEKFNLERKKKSDEIKVELKTVERVEDGTSYEQEVWEFQVEEEAKIPKKYLKVDDGAIRKALSNGIRNIDGLKIFKTIKKRYRVK